MKTVVAVIVSYNNSAMLQSLLGELASQSRPPDRIIVVDNASSDGTQEAIQTQFPAVDYIRMPENTGSAGGYHHGMKAALGRVTTSGHSTMMCGCALTRSKSFSRVRLAETRVQARGSPERGGNHPEPHPTRLHIIPWRGTLFSSEAVSEVSLPLSEYFLYGEDLDFSLRLARKGYQCFWIPTSHCVENRNKGKSETRLFSHTEKIYSSPFRLYYAFRNQTAIYLRFGACRPLLQNPALRPQGDFILPDYRRRREKGEDTGRSEGNLGWTGWPPRQESPIRPGERTGSAGPGNRLISDSCPVPMAPASLPIRRNSIKGNFSGMAEPACHAMEQFPELRQNTPVADHESPGITDACLFQR